MDARTLLYLVGLFAVYGVYYYFAHFRLPKEDEQNPSYKAGLNEAQDYRYLHQEELYHADRKDPVKAWFHGVYALQYGLKTDPGYWSVPEAQEHMSEAWGFDSVETTLASLEWYLEEPVNAAYDMVRAIIVARSCLAAGWLSEAKSNLICNLAQHRILDEVDDWEQLAQEVHAGRLVVFKGKLPRGRQKRDQSNLEFARKHIFRRVTFRVQPPALIPDEDELLAQHS